MAKPTGGPFGGYRTRQEQLDAQEKAASLLPEPEEEEMEPPEKEAMYADGAFGVKKRGKKGGKKGHWPWY